MVVTVPISTPLYRILVLPASRPSAESRVIVILGPSLMTLVTATHTPTNAAKIGMNQTNESRVRLLDTALELGTGGIGVSGSGMLNLFRTGGIPDQARVEGFDRKHRQHHDRRKKKQAGRGRHRHQWLELNQGCGEGVDEHIDHRPASDEVDHSIHPDALLIVLRRATLRCYEEVRQRENLCTRDHNAREEHDQ